MATLSEIVRDAKTALQATKPEAVDGVADAKARLLNIPANQDFLSDRLNTTVEETGQFLDQVLSRPDRAIHQDENTIVREDGSVDVIAHDGSIIKNVRRDLIPNLVAREQAKAKDFETGASANSFIENEFTNIGQGATNLANQFSKGLIGLGHVQTLPQAVERNNKLAQDRRLNIKGDIKHISKKHLIDYSQIKQLRQSGQPLSLIQKKFAASDTFASIFNLEAKVREGRELLAGVDQGEKEFNAFIPTTRADEVSMQLGFEQVAKNEGTLAGLKHSFTNDFATMVRGGVGSIPYMIAFTMGGALAQTNVLVLLSKGKASELTSQFEHTHKRPPTSEEQVRIDAFAAASVAAEKVGDMVAVGILNKVKIPRILNTKKIIDSMLPESVKAITRGPLVAGSIALGNLAGRSVRKPGIALTGEASSGGLTSAAEQMALSGEITNPDQIAFDAMAEAIGTVGGLGGILAGREAVRTAELAKNIVSDFRKEKQARRDDPLSSETPSDPGLGKDSEGPSVATPIEVSKFDKAIDDIKEVIAASTPDSIREAFRKLSDLNKRELTKEQTAKHKEILDEHIKNLKNLADFDNSKTTLGSLGPIDELTPEDLQELSVNQDTTEADKIFINSIIEAQELADEIRGDSANVQEIDKTAAKSTTIEDFNNILNEIRGVPSDSTFGTAETKATRVSNLVSQLSTQLSNVQNKLSAVVAASKFTPKAGEVAAVRASRTDPADPNNLGLEFSEPISLSEAQIIEEEEAGSTIIRVESDATKQIELLNKEAEFGNLVVDLAAAHPNTSFAQTATHQAGIQRLAQESIKRLQAQKPPTAKKEAEPKVTNTPESTEPAPSKTKTDKAVKKTVAQEFINPTVSKDPAVINRKVWENKEIEVTNEDGTKEKVKAGDLWDTLHEDLEMADNLIECVKG